MAAELAAAGADIVIAGHTGLPFIKRIGQRVWFNPGVIGMPANDGTPQVWYGLIDVGGNELFMSLHRLTYDHLGAAAATKDAGYANVYAQALVSGLWPSMDVLPQRERAARGRAIPESAVRLVVRPFEGEQVKTTISVCWRNETRNIAGRG
jgi:hypothetical protein